MSPRTSIAVGFAAGVTISLIIGGAVKPSGSRAGAGAMRDAGPRRPVPLAFAGTEETAVHPTRLDALFQEKDKSAWRAEISRWSRHDPAAAWDQVWRTAPLPWLRTHPQALLEIAREWAPRDPMAFKAALLEMPRGFYAPGKPTLFGGPDPRDRASLAHLLVALARVEPAAALDVARRKSGALVEYTSAFLGGLSTESPAEAAQLATSLPPGETRDRAVMGIASHWAATDPSASLAFAQANLAPRQYRTVLDQFLKGLVNVDAAALAPALAALPPGQYRADWIERVTTQWMGTDREACTAWLESLPPGPDRELALHRSAIAIATDSPEEAIAMARGLTSTSRQRAVVLSALRSWAKTDASAAITYAESLPDDQTRAKALRFLEPPATPSAPADTFASAVDFQPTSLWEIPAAGTPPKPAVTSGVHYRVRFTPSGPVDDSQTPSLSSFWDTPAAGTPPVEGKFQWFGPPHHRMLDDR